MDNDTNAKRQENEMNFTTACMYLEGGPGGPRCGASNGGTPPVTMGFDDYCGSGEEYRCPMVMALALRG